jgi:hypothetical protein
MVPSLFHIALERSRGKKLTWTKIRYKLALVLAIRNGHTERLPAVYGTVLSNHQSMQGSLRMSLMI